MALAYLDTSALVKRYVLERGSAWIKQLCETEPIAISAIASAEVASTFARKAKEGVLTAAQRDTLFGLFLSDAQSYVVIGMNKTVVQRAAVMLLTAPPGVRLRTLDALHAASAERVFGRARRRGIATGDFVAADGNLLAAAQWAGLSTVNPETQP